MARASGIDYGCHSGADSEDIRVDAEGAEAFHQMQMHVDQSRRDNLIFNIDNRRAVRIEIFTDRLDLAVAHADVENTILAASGIDQPTTFEQKIWGLSIHRFLSRQVFLKFEIRISKSETISKFEINPKLKSESSFLFET